MYVGVFFLAVLLWLPLSSPANATMFGFTQYGFSEGAFVSGTFEADDANHNGEISIFDGEVSDFMATFSGSSLVAAFVMDFAHLEWLVYDLDGIIGNTHNGDGDPLSDPGEGIGWVNDPVNFYIAGNGALGVPPCPSAAECGQVTDYAAFDETTQAISVYAVVPEPGTLTLLSLGLFGLAGVKRMNGKA